MFRAKSQIKIVIFSSIKISQRFITQFMKKEVAAGVRGWNEAQAPME